MPPKKRKIAPNGREITMQLRLLQLIPVDQPALTYWGESYAGVPYLRYEAVTSNIPWLVDIYHGSYLRAQVGSSLSEIHRNPRSLMTYLQRKLTSLE